MKPLAFILPALLAFAAPAASQPAPPVPTEYQDLHDELAAAVISFRSEIAESWNGLPTGVDFSAYLTTADSARGEALLAPTQGDAVRLELDSLKALGVRAVSLNINFPMLYAPFHESQADYQRYLDFYERVARDVRARGLALVVGTQVLFTEGGYVGWDLAPYYDSLTLAQYSQGRMEVARTIATRLRPDYLAVVQEPDTEAAQAGKPELGTLDGAAAQLDLMLAGVRAAGVEGVALGGGIGTWMPDYATWAERFASADVDFLDMHVYPANRDFLSRALAIADIARAHGKRVGMTEFWLYKIRDSELRAIHFGTILARDTFSFWAPLDGLFLETMTEFAELKALDFMSPFWSGYLHAYVDYGPLTRDLPPDALNALAQAAQAAAILAGTYTSAGLAFKDAIVDPPDVTPPSPPTDVAAQLTSATSVVVRWGAATDDVGTAAYRVYRDGAFIGQTADRFMLDAGLGEAQRYEYSVVAADASGNDSTPATTSITTPDTTAPSVPADLAVDAVTSGPRIDINLSWPPSADNVGVTSYRIYRGTAPSSLTLIALSDTPSFTIANAAPEMTWHFAVSALDAAWNDSGQSAPVAVTTPTAPDLTAPTVYISYPTEGSRLPRNAVLYAGACDLRSGTFDEPSGLAGVAFHVDGVSVAPEQTVPTYVAGRCAAYQVSFDASGLANGTHAITATARDAAGNHATSAAVTVTVRN